MVLDIKDIINSYISYIHANFDIHTIDRNTYEIITPFLDRRNDRITFYIQQNKDFFRLTDGGETLESLSLDGLEFKTTKKSQQL